MAAFRFPWFGRRPAGQKKKEKKGAKKPRQQRAVKAVKKEAEIAGRAYRQAGEQAYDILRSPHVTEKATMLREKGQYVFEVSPRATAGKVKAAVEGAYKTKVRDVRMIKSPHKKMRLGRQEGLKRRNKKAIVSLKQGEKIEIIPG